MTVLVPPYSGGIQGANTQQLLFLLKNANVQTAGDQPFTRVFSGTNYVVQSIVGRGRAGTPSVLTAGGIYDGPNRSGNAIGLGSQLWTGAGIGLVINVSLGSLIQSTLLSATPNFNLTVTSLTAALVDVYIWGFDLT